MRRERRGQALLEFLAICPVLIFLFAVFLNFGNAFVVKGKARAAARYAAFTKVAVYEKNPDIDEATLDGLAAQAIEKGFFFSAAQARPTVTIDQEKGDDSRETGDGSVATGNGYGGSALSGLVGALSTVTQSLSGLSDVTDFLSGALPGGCVHAKVSGVAIAPFAPKATTFAALTREDHYYTSSGNWNYKELGAGGVKQFIPGLREVPSITIPVLGTVP